MSSRKSNTQERPPSDHVSSGKPSAGRSLKVVLVAVDFSECSLGALDMALQLAAPFASRVILLHVIEPPVYPESLLVSPATIEKAQQDLGLLIRHRVHAARRGPVAGPVFEKLVRMGRVASEISDTARATGAALIVMGACGQAARKTKALGRTAERVVALSPCSVLLAKAG